MSVTMEVLPQVNKFEQMSLAKGLGPGPGEVPYMVGVPSTMKSNA